MKEELSTQPYRKLTGLIRIRSVPTAPARLLSPLQGAPKRHAKAAPKKVVLGATQKAQALPPQGAPLLPAQAAHPVQVTRRARRNRTYPPHRATAKSNRKRISKPAITYIFSAESLGQSFGCPFISDIFSYPISPFLPCLKPFLS